MKAIKAISAAAMSAALLCLTGCSVGFVSFGTGSTYPNADKYTAGDREITDKIDALDIEWPSGSVTVSTGSGSAVSLKETTKGTLKDSQKVHSYVDNGVLYVKFCKSGESCMIKEPKTVEITLPETLALENLSVDVSSADVECGGLKAKQASLTASSGSIAFSGSADKFRADISSGSISFSGESGDIKTTASSGKINIVQTGHSERIEAVTSSGSISIDAESAECVESQSSSGKKEIRLKEMPKKMDFSASSGDLLLYLPKDADFTASITTSSGSVNFELPMTKTGSNTYVCGSGTNKVSISASSGAVSVLKNEG